MLERWLEARQSQGRLVTPKEQISVIQSARDPERFAIRVTVLEPRPRRSLRRWNADISREHPLGAPIAKALAFGIVVAVGFLLLVLGIIHLIEGVVSSATMTGAGGVLLVLVILATSAANRPSGRHSGHDGKGWHYTDCK